MQGRIAEAIAHFQSALIKNPDDVLTHNNLGYVLMQTGRVKEAIVHFRRALEIQPGMAKAKDNLAQALAISPEASNRINQTNGSPYPNKH